MDTVPRHFALEDSDLTVEPESQLATLAELNPAACVIYADMLIKELSAAMASCTVGDASVVVADMFEQIHALKNGILPTGCQPLLDAYSALQASAITGPRRELQATFNEVAEATRRLIEAYRQGIQAC